MKTNRNISCLILTAVISAASLTSCFTSKNATTATAVGRSTATTESTVTEVNRADDQMVSTMPVKGMKIMRLDSVNIMKFNGLWTLRSINGVTLGIENGDRDENRPYVNFDSRTSKFYANDGCNTINGDFKVGQDGKVAINCLLSTMMMCPDAKYEQQFKLGLADAAAFTREEKDNENILSLFNDKGTLIMTLVRPMTDFLNGSWSVVEINGKAIENTGVKMVIDIPELRVHGNTGCNTFNGSIFVDPDKNGSIQFREVACTRMLCPDMTTESDFLVALEAVEYANNVNGYAILYNAHHKPVLKLKALPLNGR